MLLFTSGIHICIQMTAIFDFPGKMIIPIVRESGALPEWAIVELQGNLEAYQQVIDPKTERFIGDLHFQKKDDHSVILIIGMHILYGKEVTLPKPLGVLIKKSGEINNRNENIKETRDEWIIKALVRKKLIFKTRPKPIVADMPKST